MFDFDPFCFERGPFDNLFDRKGSTNVYHVHKWLFFNIMKTFFFFFNFTQQIEQKSVKPIYISCKDNFGFKYTNYMYTCSDKTIVRTSEHNELDVQIFVINFLDSAKPWKSSKMVKSRCGQIVNTRRPTWPFMAHLITRQVWVNWPFDSRGKVQYWFSRWGPSWISNQNDFSYFWSSSHLETSNEVWVNYPFGSAEKVQNRLSTWLLGLPSGILIRITLAIFLSTNHPDTSYQILSQWAFLFRRSSK